MKENLFQISGYDLRLLVMVLMAGCAVAHHTAFGAVTVDAGFLSWKVNVGGRVTDAHLMAGFAMLGLFCDGLIRIRRLIIILGQVVRVPEFCPRHPAIGDHRRRHDGISRSRVFLHFMAKGATLIKGSAGGLSRFSHKVRVGVEDNGHQLVRSRDLKNTFDS